MNHNSEYTGPVNTGGQRRGGVPASPSEGVAEVSLLKALSIFLRHRWKVLSSAVLAGLVVVGIGLLDSASYTSEASFMPQPTTGGGTQISRLSGVASQFGINVPSGDIGVSPQFYAELITSRRILQSAVQSDYTIERNGSSIHGDLPKLHGMKSGRPRSTEVMINWLREHLSIDTNPETGLVNITVTTGNPDLSKQLAQRVIELVHEFNLDTRQSQASAQAEFVEERLKRARAELRAAEDSLERFLERNRSFQNSPRLRFEHQRLQRRLDLRQQVYTSLATRYEEAQIDEVRNTPVITVVTPPSHPATPDSTRLPLKASLGLLFGAILGLFWALGTELIQSVRKEENRKYQELRSSWQDMVEDLRLLPRKIARLVHRDDSR